MYEVTNLICQLHEHPCVFKRFLLLLILFNVVNNNLKRTTRWSRVFIPKSRIEVINIIICKSIVRVQFCSVWIILYGFCFGHLSTYLFYIFHLKTNTSINPIVLECFTLLFYHCYYHRKVNTYYYLFRNQRENQVLDSISRPRR